LSVGRSTSAGKLKAFGAADPLTEEVAHNLEIVLRNQ
jgi:hypothetical protein